jgi:hypothetical protein
LWWGRHDGNGGAHSVDNSGHHGDNVDPFKHVNDFKHNDCVIHSNNVIDSNDGKHSSGVRVVNRE